jgi:quercetin dioxygenase-like cupin family protein
MEPAILSDYHACTRFAAERFSPVPLVQTDRLKVVLTCLEAGQFIPVHAPGADMLLVVLESVGAVVARQTECSVSRGSIIVVPVGESRGVKASTRLVTIHVVSLPPGESDHAAVQAGLERGTWC